MDILIITAVIAMVISKLLDCLSTHNRIREVNDEMNFFGRIIMDGLTLRKGIWAVFFLSLIIIASSTWILYAYYPTPFYKGIFVVVAFFISIVQLAVAHSNYTGRPNFIIRQLRRLPLFR